LEEHLPGGHVERRRQGAVVTRKDQLKVHFNREEELMRIALITLAVLLVVPAAVTAQELESGIWVSFNLEQTTVEQSDGSMLRYSTDNQYSTTHLATGPDNNMRFKCLGMELISESGDVIGAAGSCQGSNPDGDVQWQRWSMTEAGTEECPIRCGVWEVFKGTGFFEGKIEGGTWETTAIHPDGSASGTWKRKYVKE